MTVRKIRPSPPLQEFVRYYLYREASITDRVVVRPVVARADPFLGFHLRDPYEVFEYAPGRARVLPTSYIVGPQTRRLADLLLRGNLSGLYISFQPTGLHRLFRAQMAELTDHAYDAVDVLGADIRALGEYLRECASLREMIRAVEGLLLDKARDARPLHPIEQCAASILRTHGRTSLGALARESGISERQFERNFAGHVGVGPKRYARIARLGFAVRLKEQCPDLTWTAISHQAGYFDQTHLIRDFKSLLHAKPSAFMRSLEGSHGIFPVVPAETVPASDFYYPAPGFPVSLAAS